MPQRVETARDESLTIREDIMLDILDLMLLVGTDEKAKRTSPKTFDIWHSEDYNDNELPAISIYDTESSEDTPGGFTRHKLNVVLEFVGANGKDTSSQVNAGMQDMLAIIKKYEQSFYAKYRMEPMQVTGTTKGLESINKIRGAGDVTIEVPYKSDPWSI